MLVAILLASIPMLAALGHDFYLLQLHPEKGFEFSDLGFIWIKYHPESYKQAIEAVPTEYWEIINTALTQEAFYIGTAISVLFYIIIAISGFLKSSDKKHKKAMADAARKWKKPN